LSLFFLLYSFLFSFFISVSAASLISTVSVFSFLYILSLSFALFHLNPSLPSSLLLYLEYLSLTISLVNLCYTLPFPLIYVFLHPSLLPLSSQFSPFSLSLSFFLAFLLYAQLIICPSLTFPISLSPIFFLPLLVLSLFFSLSFNFLSYSFCLFPYLFSSLSFFSFLICFLVSFLLLSVVKLSSVRPFYSICISLSLHIFVYIFSLSLSSFFSTLCIFVSLFNPSQTFRSSETSQYHCSTPNLPVQVLRGTL